MLNNIYIIYLFFDKIIFFTYVQYGSADKPNGGN